jgi:hypothetical protein
MSALISDISSVAGMGLNSLSVHYITNSSRNDKTTKGLNQMAMTIRRQPDRWDHQLMTP